MVVDPEVSRRKFEREVAVARAYVPFQRQGVWIMRAEYPLVFAVLVVNKPFPVKPGVLCGVHLDFSDYDVRPPSVRLVDPFNEDPLPLEACWAFPRVKKIIDPASGKTSQEAQVLLQAFDNKRPFFCLQGVREYHECSAHSGDSWFLHRKPNMLVHLLNILHQYGPCAAVIQFEIKPQLAARVVS